MRTFLGFVTLYITATKPEEVRNEIVKFTLNNDNCQKLIKWAQLENGSEVTITRTQGEGIPRNRTYKLDEVKYGAIDADSL